MLLKSREKNMFYHRKHTKREAETSTTFFLTDNIIFRIYMIYVYIHMYIQRQQRLRGDRVSAAQRREAHQMGN